MSKLKTRKSNGMTTFNGWTLIEQLAKQLSINPSDVRRPKGGGKMTSEDSYMIGTDLMFYHDDDDDDDDDDDLPNTKQDVNHSATTFGCRMFVTLFMRKRL
jgi:hypothetical protein